MEHSLGNTTYDLKDLKLAPFPPPTVTNSQRVTHHSWRETMLVMGPLSRTPCRSCPACPACLKCAHSSSFAQYASRLRLVSSAQKSIAARLDPVQLLWISLQAVAIGRGSHRMMETPIEPTTLDGNVKRAQCSGLTAHPRRHASRRARR